MAAALINLAPLHRPFLQPLLFTCDSTCMLSLYAKTDSHSYMVKRIAFYQPLFSSLLLMLATNGERESRQ